MPELERLSVEAYKKLQRRPLILVLDNLRSGLNVGSIFRTADAFGVAKIYCCGITAAPPHREVLKSALGSTDTVEWEHVDSTVDAIERLKAMSFCIAGIEQAHNSTSLQDFRWDGTTPLAIILGNEVEGIGDEALELCDLVLELPQVGTKHSLNVAVCAGVVVYGLVKEN